MANMKDKEQRHFLGMSKASKQTDQMSHYSVFLGREANKSFTKSCWGKGQPWKIVPDNLQGTPEYLQDVTENLFAFTVHCTAQCTVQKWLLPFFPGSIQQQQVSHSSFWGLCCPWAIDRFHPCCHSLVLVHAADVLLVTGRYSTFHDPCDNGSLFRLLPASGIVT